MSISIVLDRGSDTLFADGETLSGRVELALKKEARGGTIWIEVICETRAEVRVERNRNNEVQTEYYHSTGVPLYLQQQIFDDPNTVDTRGQTFPFSFKLPWHTNRNPADLVYGDEDKFSDDNPFIPNHNHIDTNTRLPPSYTEDDDNYVRYFVRAEFRPQEGHVSLFHKGLNTEVDFTFRPTVEDNYWSSNSFASDTALCNEHIRSYGILDSSFDKGHGVGDHLKKWFHSDSVPKLNFAIKTTYPTEIPPNFVGRLPILIQIARAPTMQDKDCKYGEEDINVTQAKIVKLDIELNQYTRSRARGHTRDWSTDWDMFNFKSDTGMLVDVDQTNVNSNAETGAPIKFEFQWPATDDSVLTSTFSSYNLALWYTLTVKAKIEMGGETWKGKLLDEQEIDVISCLPWQ